MQWPSQNSDRIAGVNCSKDRSLCAPQGWVAGKEKILSTDDAHSSPLDETINRLFETDLGVKGEEVTLEYIRDARATREYPMDHSTDFGGRTLEGLKEIDSEEAVELMREIDEFVNEFASVGRQV